ncbi:MAG: helix-turn-helix domain-containing protein [Rhodobacteraceae bacterium]|nr:MAG: helix-turn-helix domain-containing protein [Paracoccaceae bacterium]
MTQKPARYYTIPEVAKIFGVTRATVDRWHRDRPDFPRKVLLGPGSARFRVTDIDAWLESREVHLDV